MLLISTYYKHIAVKKVPYFRATIELYNIDNMEFMNEDINGSIE
jgi:hypothetical protein